MASHRAASSAFRYWRTLWTRLLGGSLVLVCFSGMARADIATDGSTGPARELNGPNYEISEELGRLLGGNLFHSFWRFNLSPGEIAMFTGSSAIENIIARVTGGDPSSIDGQISSTIPGVNLFLMNPYGMMFGANASLDIGGSFHVSTAHELRFSDGQVFSADLGGESVFTVASPTAFGFTREEVAPLTVAGSNLSVQAGETLSVVGGDLTITGGSLQAPGGTLALASVASSGTVPVGGESQNMELDTFDELGTIDLSNSANLSTSGNSGGTVVIRGGKLMIDQAFVTATNSGSMDSPGVGIDIDVADDMTLTNGAFILSGVPGSGGGRAGDIRVAARNVTISDNASIVSFNVRRGESGDILVQAQEAVSIIDQDGDEVQTGILSFGGGSGAPNELRVEASRLEMRGGVVGTPLDLVAGRAGDVSVAVEQLTMTDGAIIDSRSNQGVAGGAIQITARAVFLYGNSSIITDASDAPGGDIEIDADLIRLQDSSITATAQGDERAQGGNVAMSAEAGVVVLERSEIKAEAGGGNGGVIRIQGFLVSDRESTISADSDRGTDGTIVIRAAINTLGSFSPLPQNFAQSRVVLSKRCAEQLRGGTVSSLIQTGRDGVPADPSGGLPGFMVGVLPEEESRVSGLSGQVDADRELVASQVALMLDCPKALGGQLVGSRTQ